MKLSLTYTFHYILFLTSALFVGPGNNIHACNKSEEIKIEKNKQALLAREDTEELLHGALFFRY
jgi:hypothetical protein